MSDTISVSEMRDTLATWQLDDEQPVTSPAEVALEDICEARTATTTTALWDAFDLGLWEPDGEDAFELGAH